MLIFSLTFLKSPGSKSCLDSFNGCSGSFPFNYLPVPEWVVLVQSALQILQRPQISWVKPSKSHKLLSEQWNLWSQASCASSAWILRCLITSVSLKWLHMCILGWLIRGELTLWLFSPEDFLSPRPISTWEVGTQCIWVLSPAVAFGWSYQTVLRVIEGEGMNSKDRWTRMHAHTQAVWWPFKLATAKCSASLPPCSLQAARCFSECAWHRHLHSWVVNWSHLEMCE